MTNLAIDKKLNWEKKIQKGFKFKKKPFPRKFHKTKERNVNE